MYATTKILSEKLSENLRGVKFFGAPCNVIQTIHCNVGLKYFFQFCQNVCLLLSLCMHISLIFHKVV